MRSCICGFDMQTKHNDVFKDGEYILIRIPYYTVLQIVNKQLHEEYLFSVNYCPRCGRDVKYPIK